MKSSSQIAFKEWAVIIRAIANKKQSIILRKGGIHEHGGEFQIEHTEFFLFPTYEHQNETDLKSDAHADLKRSWEERRNKEEICIKYYVRVKKIIQILNENELQAISNPHLWSEEVLHKRFIYGKKKGLYLLLIEPFKLLKPVIIPNLTRYAGCKSWVELEHGIPLSPSAPLFDAREASAFLEKLNQSLPNSFS